MAGDSHFVFVTRHVPGPALGRLAELAHVEIWSGEEPVPREILLERASRASALLTMLTERIDEELLGAAPQLRVVANYGVGYDNVDVAACTRHGVAVGNTPGVLTNATADLAMALVLATARRLGECVEFVRAGNWTTWAPEGLLGLELAGATIGIVGTGRIGAAVARRARGFDLELLGWSRSQPAIEGLEYVSFEELLERADVVSLHVPLSDETRHLIGPEQLDLIGPAGILVNTGRGGLVDQLALVEALRDGRLGAAGLDVTDPEPIAADDPLLGLPNCVVLPHVGSATVAARTAMTDCAVSNVLAALAGAPLPYPVAGSVQAGG